MFLVYAVCRQVEVSATGRSLEQRSRMDCVCVSLSVIRCKDNPFYPQYVDRKRSE